MKIIGMIPARLGSTRVKNKNLRLINGIPLIQYVINAAKDSELLDEIYINSEAEIFDQIAENNSLQFYKRPAQLASNEATNDDFALDFMSNINGDLLIQLLPTSPFITTKEIDGFIQSMLDGSYQTMISVSNVQIECMFDHKALNFNQN